MQKKKAVRGAPCLRREGEEGKRVCMHAGGGAGGACARVGMHERGGRAGGRQRSDAPARVRTRARLPETPPTHPQALREGQSGNAAQYLTRNQALKKLQLRLSEFRRLCILKGIHPREPKKKPAGAHKTYYHVKDIAYLLHEPLLKKVRELHAHEKKVRRARAKRNRDAAKRLEAGRPTYRLDHLVKER